MSKVYWVDLPNPHTSDFRVAPWVNVLMCDTWEEAVEFVKEHLGGDDAGRISLITTGEGVEDECDS